MMDVTILKHLEAQDRLSRDAAARKADDARRRRRDSWVASGAVLVVLTLAILGAVQLAGCAPSRDVAPSVPPQRSLLANGSNGGG